MTLHSPSANEKRPAGFICRTTDHRCPRLGLWSPPLQPPQGRVRQRPLRPSALCISKREHLLLFFFLFRIPLQQHQVKHKLICRHTGSTLTAVGWGPDEDPTASHTNTARPFSGLLDPRAKGGLCQAQSLMPHDTHTG